jgi:hypothetical protein
MDMLRNDLRALKTCSLTCRAMFASTRHLIYRTLHLPPQNYLRDPAGLRFLSLRGEHGLFQYARKVHIHLPPTLTSDILLPHLRHFQSLDRVHALTVDYYDPITWTWPEHYKTCFIHFYPTLTSLTLHHPSGHHRVIFQFALQFPNLENLCLESVEHELWHNSGMIVPAIVDRSPPLRGHLRLVGIVPEARYLIDLAYELPNGINFRSVELEGFAGSCAQHILNGCAHTLENLIIVPRSTGTYPLSPLSSIMTERLADFLPTGRRRGVCGSHIRRDQRPSPVDFPHVVQLHAHIQTRASPRSAFDHHVSCLLRTRA